MPVAFRGHCVTSGPGAMVCFVDCLSAQAEMVRPVHLLGATRLPAFRTTQFPPVLMQAERLSNVLLPALYTSSFGLSRWQSDFQSHPVLCAPHVSGVEKQFLPWPAPVSSVHQTLLQMPATQPLLVSHTRAQPPQFSESLVVSTHPAAPQFIRLSGQVFMISTECGGGHRKVNEGTSAARITFL
jgi:hypothetical protein